MLIRVPGNKVGMTQLFNENREAVSVTVVEVSHWFVTQIKTNEKEGYSALQLGKLKERFWGMPFAQEWLGKKARYFSQVCEVPLADEAEEKNYSVGQEISLDNCAFEVGAKVCVAGKSRGLGFQGVVKRWGFGGGPKSHGSTFHRAPGSIGHMCTQGEVIKGKKLPGQQGQRKVTVQGLQVVRLDKDLGYLFIKGAVPGKANTFLMINKQG